MSKVVINIILLAVCWVLVAGAGVYVTYVEQPKEMERLAKAEKVAKLKLAEVSALLAEESASKQRAEEIVRRWRARYKVIPSSLESHAFVGYLNELSQTGFNNFDVTYDGLGGNRDVQEHKFKITGRGYYNALYEVVWALENNRQFFRVQQLRLDHIDLMKNNSATAKEELHVMVSFTMDVAAYFGGAEGLSAGVKGSAIRPVSLTDASADFDLPPVPASVLPAPKPAANPFFPIIMESIPPNTYNRLDLDKATLISIVGDKAIFSTKDDFVGISVGEEVYLGQITLVDPTEGRVVARLNKGGIIDEVEMVLQTGERYRQAIGPLNLAPTGQ